MKHSTRLTLSALALAALTACGGGGGSSGSTTTTTNSSGTSGSTGSTGGATTTTVAAGGTLVTSSATSTYAAGSMGQGVYDALNAARLASGSGAVTQSASLDTAAGAHAAYLTSVNAAYAGFTSAQQAEFAAGSIHNEYADLVPASLFYATTAQDRAIKAGAITSASGAAGEGITGGFTITNNQIVVDGAACASGLLNTVYHADGLLGPWTLVGVGQFADSVGEPGCVVDYAHADQYGQVRPAGSVVVNPAPGATVPGTFRIDSEVPRPAVAQITTSTAGEPILVSIYNADYINAGSAAAPTVTKFEVRDAGDVLVDTVLLAASGVTGTGLNTDTLLLPGTVVAIPKAPLVAGVYSVSFAGTIKGAAVTKQWTFTAQ